MKRPKRRPDESANLDRLEEIKSTRRECIFRERRHEEQYREERH